MYCKGHFSEGPTDVLIYTLRPLANFDETVMYTSNIFYVNVVMSRFDLLLIHFMS